MSDKRQNPAYTYKGEKPSRAIHPKARKNTRRWCKGIVGREHITAVVIPDNGYRHECFNPAARGWSWWKRDWVCAHVVMCEVCGKHVRRLPSGDCPDNPVNISTRH